jgi:poly(3-hydroxybutyrate) depolymerase
MEMVEKQKNEINQFNYLTKHVIIAPQGYKKSWNIGREESKAPDVDFINKIITHLDNLKNIDKNDISIIGYLNGSALINQLTLNQQFVHLVN